MTGRPRSTSMLDVLKSLSVEPGTDSNDLFHALSMSSARFDEIGARLLRVTERLLPSTLPGSSESSPTTATSWPTT